MNGNVQLTKKQVVALESTIEFHKNFLVGKDEPKLDGKSSIVQDHARMIAADGSKGRANWGTTSAALNDLSLDDLITALYVGYDTIPLKPEEQLVEKYHDKENHPANKFDYYQCGIRDALNTLGIKIDGINK